MGEHIYTFIYLLSNLNPWGIQHRKDSVANGFSRKVALEFDMSHVIVSMSTRYFPLDYSGFFRFATRSHCVVLCFVHLRIQFHLEHKCLQFKKSRVFSQVPETPLIASKNGLGPQTFSHSCSFRSLVPSSLHGLQDGRKRKASFIIKTVFKK